MRLNRSASLTGFAEIARSLGLDPYRLAAAAGIPPAALTDPDLKISSLATGALLESAARRAGIDDFGLRMAELRRLSNMGAVGLIARDQPSLRKALEVMAQYLWMQTDAMSLAVEEMGDIALAVLSLDTQGRRTARQATELSVGTLCRNLGALMGPAWTPQAVLFRHGPPQNPQVHRRVFGRLPEFGQEADGLVLRREELDAPLASADPVMALQVERYVSQLAQRRRRTQADEVGELIGLLLPTGTCTAERVARQLGFDRRTLHRKLAVEKTTFAELLDAKRRDLVLSLLTDPRRGLTAISDLAGFASPSSFSHWFRRALGRAPRDYRRLGRTA
jgi:AraC-like DNA-binding protein